MHVHVLALPYGHTPEEMWGYLDPAIRLTSGPAVAAEAEILVGGYPTQEQIEASPALRAVIIPWSGVPEATMRLLAAHPHIAVHNLHHNAPAVAEMALALLFAAAKCVLPADRLLRQHDWSARFWQPDPALVLADKSVLILGYGAIGQRVARGCLGLGMRVHVIRQRQTTVETSEGITWYPRDQLATVLPHAAVLILCLPLTPATRRMLGAAELRLLPRGAILVNVSRAEIVDEAALYHALRDGMLHSAGLDVWYANPGTPEEGRGTPPAHHPFHTLDNVVMSPHRAGHAAEIEHQRMIHLARMLNGGARGEPLADRVRW